LKSGSDILQTEEHNSVAADVMAGGEGSLVLVFWMYLNLIVSSVGIHKTEELVACSCINYMVYVWAMRSYPLDNPYSSQ